MLAQLLHQVAPLSTNPTPLRLEEIAIPQPGAGQLLLEVSVCGVCHTELDEIEGRTPPAFLPLILGHQVIGRLVENGPGANLFSIGTRLGIAWIFSACGECKHCLQGNENLCAQFQATGRDAHGGYAQYALVPQDFAIPIPTSFSDIDAAPLLCAGAVGYRSLCLAAMQNGMALGFAGFGASAHIVLQLARHLFPDSPLYVFSRSETEQSFARQLGADWAGSFEDTSPVPLDRIIDTTPAWKPVLHALHCLAPGGKLVINAIRKEEADRSLLAGLDYADHLWQEKEIKSTANVTRHDVSEFLAIAADLAVRPEVQVYPLEDANTALQELKSRQIHGAKVLKINRSASLASG